MLRIFEGRIARLKEEQERVRKAKAALDLEHGDDDRLQPIEEEMADLKGTFLHPVSYSFSLPLSEL